MVVGAIDLVPRGATVSMNEVVSIDVSPLDVEEAESDPEDSIAVVMQLFGLEAKAHHRK